PNLHKYLQRRPSYLFVYNSVQSNTRTPLAQDSHYQLPRSPSVSITRLSRTAAFRQFVCTARSAPGPSPSAIASTITRCSLTDVADRKSTRLNSSHVK